MTSRLDIHKKDDDDEVEEEDNQIRWSNILFLPFHPVFKLIVLFSVIVKTIMGPIQAVYPLMYCSDALEQNFYFAFIKFFYSFCCDAIYGIDTFLHMLHRQVTDEALRREHLPKAAHLLALDLISLIPFHRLIITEACPPVALWPNILAFTEFIVIYRVVEYFSLMTTHSFWKMLTGFLLTLVICAHCVTCILVLLTIHGLCARCTTGVYDWRKYVIHKLNETDPKFCTYVYGFAFIIMFVVNKMFDALRPSTVFEYFLSSMLLIFGYFVVQFIVLPKLFAEMVLRHRRFCSFKPNVQKIVDETKRRNPSPEAYLSVEKFYSLVWEKRSGITSLPEVITELPRYLRLEIKQDLLWAVFYHSPTLRRTSMPFKRLLCERIRLDYKLPGERLFFGPHCYEKLIYLKSGIVQFISKDDGTTPILSVTSGTIFGDISFFLPPLKRKILVRCLTYCEIFYVTRTDVLLSLHKYPLDRYNVLKLANERVKHARTLYTCKQHVRGLDRTEDEGIAWVKRRWWEISDALTDWDKNSTKDEELMREIPQEEAVYHCAKYIGQLVLCNEVQLLRKSMFANVKFPWILLPNSIFIHVWHRIVMATVYLVLLCYPPYLAMRKPSIWFSFLQFWTDCVYVCDIGVSLMTSTEKDEGTTASFARVMFSRCKTPYFLLDVISTIWLENMAVLFGKPDYYNVCQFNRLIKVYILFYDKYIPYMDVKRDLLIYIYFKIALCNFCFCYVISFFFYAVSKKVPQLTITYFFGELFCSEKDEVCPALNDKDILLVALGWTLEYLFNEYLPRNLIDIYTAISLSIISFMVYMYCKSKLIVGLYLKLKDISNYTFFVTKICNRYLHYKIHPDLMKRLQRYLNCHWKYYKGLDVMHPNILKDEPYDIYWKVHGEIAEKIIGESKAFVGADSGLIRELAFKAKFLIMPKNSTLFLFGIPCKNVTWVVQGHIQCEYHNEDGELIKLCYSPGQMLSVSAVFLGRASLRTYVAITECEVLYVKVRDFFKCLKRYPEEWSYYENCIKEYGPRFEEMFQKYIKKHKQYQMKLREDIYHNRMSKRAITDSLPISKNYSIRPQSRFIRYWLIFRVITVIVSIVSATLEGGGGADYRRILIIVGTFCDFIAVIDIVIKMFLAYYDDRGILITSIRKCMIHYMTRAFILDIIGIVPWLEIIDFILIKNMDDTDSLMATTCFKFAHLYIVTGYFDHLANRPIANIAFIKILKWQIVIILIVLGAAQYFTSLCAILLWDDHMNLVNITRRKECWLRRMKSRSKMRPFYYLYAESINLAQCGFMKFNMGKFSIDRGNPSLGIVMVTFGFLFWYIMCYSLTLLLLYSRSTTLFQHSVNQLRKFLVNERVDTALIKHATTHFRYMWIRTQGINIQTVMSERLGVVFRHDLSYFFYKQTLKALDTLLNGGEHFQRQLAGASYQFFFLPGENIVREMDLTLHIYVIHRGTVGIYKDGQKLNVLTKGAIFGILDSSVGRPIRISAVAEEHVDLLQVPIKYFQENLTEKIKEKIKSYPQMKYDFLSLKEPVRENPYNTVQYILRGRKTLKLPWMSKPMTARHNSRYSRWLFLTLFIGPFLTAFMVLLINTMPDEYISKLYWILILLDILHVAFMVSEVYTMELVVENRQCVYKYFKWRQCHTWGCFCDVMSLIIPLVTIINRQWYYCELARLLRLRLLYDFHHHFCTGFKSITIPILMKFLIVVLLLHAMTCGWIYVACKDKKFPLRVPPVTAEFNATIDHDEWTSPNNRYGGCSRGTGNYQVGDNRYSRSFLVTKTWLGDYIVSLSFIILIHTRTDMDSGRALNIPQLYYKILINTLMYLLQIWLISIMIEAAYAKYRELYQYDFNVASLLKFLEHSGLTPSLLDIVKEYVNQLWQRQRGNWLPELAQQAPLCLREDLLGSLYMHHLQIPLLFRDLPHYFQRQLVTRFRRVVIFPGKSIVQEGDIFSCIYFIHEGEVEKWYTDESGESKMLSLLSTNGYFGILPGLFPDSPFQFTYVTRTVVDLVYLRYKDWQDLLEGYPDVKQELYAAAKLLKKEFGRQ